MLYNIPWLRQRIPTITYIRIHTCTSLLDKQVVWIRNTRAGFPRIYSALQNYSCLILSDLLGLPSPGLVSLSLSPALASLDSRGYVPHQQNYLTNVRVSEETGTTFSLARGPHDSATTCRGAPTQRTRQGPLRGRVDGCVHSSIYRLLAGSSAKLPCFRSFQSWTRPLVTSAVSQ